MEHPIFWDFTCPSCVLCFSYWLMSRFQSSKIKMRGNYTKFRYGVWYRDWGELHLFSMEIIAEYLGYFCPVSSSISLKILENEMQKIDENSRCFYWFPSPSFSTQRENCIPSSLGYMLPCDCTGICKHVRVWPERTVFVQFSSPLFPALTTKKAHLILRQQRFCYCNKYNLCWLRCSYI